MNQLGFNVINYKVGYKDKRANLKNVYLPRYVQNMTQGFDEHIPIWSFIVRCCFYQTDPFN